ncbi:hypothetical protein HMPREF4655_20374 [Helicobacter pylori 35A]|nr:hypothetical protein HMPREF4655_20374 [Helicobacter pylori 35A]
MPLSVFTIKIKELVPTSFLVTRSYRVRGFSFGGCRGIFPNASYSFMGLNKLFTIKWNPKRWNNALKPYCLKFLKDIKVGTLFCI